MFFIFPTNFVYWKKIDDHENIKKKYLKIIENHANENQEILQDNFWDCRCKSSFFVNKSKNTNGLELFENDFINSVIWNPLDEMLSELNKHINLNVPKKSNIFDIWYNLYENGDWQEVHNHSLTLNPKVKYSGIYILDLNEKNTTTFFSNNEIKSWNPKGNITYFHTGDKNISEGYVLLSPCELNHYVNCCKNNRITVSFNISSEF